ncbi:unnamed protein product, partial [Nesidiocoris tenuis]
MENCKPIGSPMDPKTKLTPSEEKSQENLPYQNLIGCLMYLSVATRPDISFAVSYLSQFNSCYNSQHWNAAKRVLRYLKGTMDFSLTYQKNGQPIIGYADADWGSCTIDRRSYSGHCFIFAGSAISWSAKKQSCVALSTAEAEHAAITEATKEALHLRNLAVDLHMDQQKIKIFSDNQAAQHIAKNLVVSSRSKHIDIKLHFI